MKKFFILAAMAVACASASAQFLGSAASSSASTVNTDGWSTIYLQYNPMTFDADGEGLDFTGFTLGYNKAISVSSSIPLFVEVGGAICYAYWSEDGIYDEDVEVKINMWSLKVPISLTYDWQVSNKVSILPYAGLTFRYNLIGKYKEEYSGEYDCYGDESDDGDLNLFDDDDMNGDAWKRFQIGWQIGVNAKFNNKFLVGISYGSDFSEITDDCKFKTTSITLGLCF